MPMAVHEHAPPISVPSQNCSEEGGGRGVTRCALRAARPHTPTTHHWTVEVYVTNLRGAGVLFGGGCCSGVGVGRSCSTY